jgi:uncharacterized caspase-like protein
MRRFRWFIFLLLLGMESLFPRFGVAADNTRNLAVSAAPAKGNRVALVIGNSAYPAGALANPKNDATAIAAALKKLEFDVALVVNANKAALDNAFKQFSNKSEKADVALLFYAGHGVQVNGNNYIVPLDAQPQSERDLKREMVKMDDVIDDMGGAKVKLIFFDACRDNPLSRSFSRGGSRGMAAPVEATGTLISFATKHGNTASDGDGRHSPYTQALLAEMERPNGIEIEQMLRKVQQDVKKTTQGQQEPWRYGSLDGDFYFKAPAQQTDNTEAIQEAVRQTREQAERDRIELQKSMEKLRQEREASDLKAQESVRLAREQAERDRLESQKSLEKMRQETQASDLKAQEAVRLAREQAERDRAELQKSMEKMLKEAIARQNAVLDAERKKWQEEQPVQPHQATAAAPATLVAALGPSTTLAATRPQAFAGGKGPQPGDEWDYLARDNAFGNNKRLIWRVKAVEPTAGVLEVLLVNGKPVDEWVFDGTPDLLGAPTESSFVFGPHWDGREFSKLSVHGTGECATKFRCEVTAKMVGRERISVPAGSFDAVRFDGQVIFATRSRVFGSISIWYSETDRRLLKQTVKINAQRLGIMADETLELQAVRAPRP